MIGHAEAQRKYASVDHDKDGVLQYATHMKSGADGNDGLFSDNGATALVPRGLVDAALGWRTKALKPYHGYYFRILNGQGPNAPGGAHGYLVKNRLMGGFGLVAWPAQYGVTGILTFIVNQDGIVYQKDIAPPPGSVAPVPVTRYDPDILATGGVAKRSPTAKASTDREVFVGDLGFASVERHLRQPPEVRYLYGIECHRAP